jgi:hypothetical protein
MVTGKPAWLGQAIGVGFVADTVRDNYPSDTPGAEKKPLK